MWIGELVVYDRHRYCGSGRAHEHREPTMRGEAAATTQCGEGRNCAQELGSHFRGPGRSERMSTAEPTMRGEAPRDAVR